MEKHDAQRQKERKQRLNANVDFCCCYELNVKRKKTFRIKEDNEYSIFNQDHSTIETN